MSVAAEQVYDDLGPRFLARLRSYLPADMDCALRKEFASRRHLPKAQATRLCEVRLNYENRLKYIVHDLDRADSAQSWHGIPPPNLIVSFASTGHAHLIWVLDLPIDMTNPRTDKRSPRNFYDDVRRDMGIAIGADPGFHGLDLVHSPWSPTYATTVLHDHSYTLDELRAATPRPAKRHLFAVPDAFPVPEHSRNCNVFWTADRYAKALVRRGHDPDDGDFKQLVNAKMEEQAAWARAHIQNAGDYTSREMLDSLTSVMKRARRYAFAHLGVDRVSDRERKRRQRGSVDRDTYRALAMTRRADILHLKAQGLSVAAIADAVGCSRSEVYRLQLACSGLSEQQECALPRAPVPAHTGAQAHVHAGAREGESYVPSAVIDFPAKLPPRERLQTEVAEFPASAAQNAENPDLRPGERLTDFAWTLNADLHGVELRLIRLRDALVEFRRPQPRAELISEPDVIAVAEAIVCEAQDRVDFAEPTAVVNTGPAAPSDVRGEPVSRLAQLLAKRSPRAAEIFVQSRRARSLFVVRPRSPAEARAAWVQKSRAP